MRPNSDLVAVGYVKLLAGMPTGRVGITLPRDDAQLRSPGFVQITVTGGIVDEYLLVARPALTVDCWVAPADGSLKAPWGAAYALAEAIRVGTVGRQAARTVDLSGIGSGYDDAFVYSAYPTSEPRRILSDQGAYARVSIDLQIHWAVLTPTA
jgi:hypothetical protein